MQLSFCKVYSNINISISKLEIHQHFIPLIAKENNLPSGKNWIFLFGRVDFNPEIHGRCIQYFFSENNAKIDRIVVSEDEDNYQVTYKFDNLADIKKNLNEDDMLFLCAILHNLNLKSYLTAFLTILLCENGMTMEEVKKYVKDDIFNMTIFTS